MNVAWSLPESHSTRKPRRSRTQLRDRHRGLRKYVDVDSIAMNFLLEYFPHRLSEAAVPTSPEPATRRRICAHRFEMDGAPRERGQVPSRPASDLSAVAGREFLAASLSKCGE